MEEDTDSLDDMNWTRVLALTGPGIETGFGICSAKVGGGGGPVCSWLVLCRMDGCAAFPPRGNVAGSGCLTDAATPPPLCSILT
jgi:hypothetical protein